MLQTALHFSHQLLKEVVEPGDFVIDATMGNGHDTAFLAELVGPSGEVFAFDIQKEALINTEQKLTELNLLPQTTLFPLGHEHLHAVLDEETEITAAIFNLGYLPKSNKEIITKPATTKQALDGLLPHLVKGSRKPYHKMFTVSYVMSLSIKKISHLFFSVLKRNKRTWSDCLQQSDHVLFYLFCYSVNSPSRIRTTRSQYFNKRSSCVTMIIPLSFSLASFASNWTTSNAFSVSKLAVGSSAKITSGS